MFDRGVFEELPVVGVGLGAEVLVVFSAVARAGGVGFASSRQYVFDGAVVQFLHANDVVVVAVFL